MENTILTKMIQVPYKIGRFQPKCAFDSATGVNITNWYLNALFLIGSAGLPAFTRICIINNMRTSSTVSAKKL